MVKLVDHPMAEHRDPGNPFGRWARRIGAAEGLTGYGLVLATLLASLMVFARDPSLFLNPQFWAEDGRYWFADAYNHGWLRSLAASHAGYLNVVQRLGGGLALLAPLRWAPLPMALWGLLWQVLPVPLLLSRRCRNWAPLWVRLAFALVYIAMPNAHEIHVVCTNAQWHLALVAVLIAFASPPESPLQGAFDIAVLLVGTLSGPFCILLIPLVLIFWYVRRVAWSRVVAATLICGSILQLFVMETHKAERILTPSGRPDPLGATPAIFIRILGGDVFRAALFGSEPYGMKSRLAANLIFVAIGLGICAYCSRYASAEVRLFLAFCFCLFAASLRSPLASPVNGSVWSAILGQASFRYWFFPSVAFLYSIVWLAFCSPTRIMRHAAVVLSLALCIGIIKDWMIPPMPDLQYGKMVSAFNQAPPGTTFSIPINPPSWDMKLVKK
jgi:hypothetical protein